LRVRAPTGENTCANGAANLFETNPDSTPSSSVTTALLSLLQLADSALPVGSAAHSFGLETLAFDGILAPTTLDDFFREYLREVGVVDATVCATGHGLVPADSAFESKWVELCDVAGALKPARESREASAVLGRRLLRLVASLDSFDTIERALATSAPAHYAAAFGLAAALLGVDEESTVGACLHQSLTGLVSVCQRAMPVGQLQASRLLWDLKPDLVAAASEGRATDLADVRCFAPLLDVGSMRHRRLPTRLFIS
jgi:urease accessory protein